MTRPLRLEFPGALYHVTARGNRRENIYEDADDREKFLAIFTDVCDRHNWLCYAYCLMGNHYHLLIETPDGNLSRGMRQLNGVYTQNFNRRHKRIGHVFQGRYKSILVDKENYLLELSRYIVLNPVRAEMVRAVQDWPWSSYRATIGEATTPPWLHISWLLSRFGQRRYSCIKKYKQFVNEGKCLSPPWAHLKNQIYLGDEVFVKEMQSLCNPNEDLSEIPSAQKRTIPKTLEEYKLMSEDRDEAIVLAYASGGYSMKVIGDFFGLHYSRVSRILKKAKGKT